MIAVILATHNRAADLNQTLSTFTALQVPAGLAWELVIVDNASRDETRQVSERWKDRLPIRYLFVGELGKSAALNRAFDETNAELALLTDDDVNVDSDWLAAYHRATT